MWHCKRCNVVLCMRCKDDGHNGARIDTELPAVVVQTQVASSPEASSGEQEEESPLSLLLQLPPVLPVKVSQTVPKRARRRAAKIVAVLLEQLMCAMDESEGQQTESGLWFGRLFLNIYALFFWKTAERGPSSTNSEEEKWETVRRRLQLAEAGRWSLLVQELCNECSRAKSVDD